MAAHKSSPRTQHKTDSRHVHLQTAKPKTRLEMSIDCLNHWTVTLSHTLHSTRALIGRNSRETLIGKKLAAPAVDLRRASIRNSATMKSIEANLSFIMPWTGVYDLKSGQVSMPNVTSAANTAPRQQKLLLRARVRVLLWLPIIREVSSSWALRKLRLAFRAMCEKPAIAQFVSNPTGVACGSWSRSRAHFLTEPHCARFSSLHNWMNEMTLCLFIYLMLLLNES